MQGLIYYYSAPEDSYTKKLFCNLGNRVEQFFHFPNDKKQWYCRSYGSLKKVNEQQVKIFTTPSKVQKVILYALVIPYAVMLVAKVIVRLAEFLTRAKLPAQPKVENKANSNTQTPHTTLSQASTQQPPRPAPAPIATDNTPKFKVEENQKEKPRISPTVENKSIPSNPKPLIPHQIPPQQPLRNTTVTIKTDNPPNVEVKRIPKEGPRVSPKIENKLTPSNPKPTIPHQASQQQPPRITIAPATPPESSPQQASGASVALVKSDDVCKNEVEKNESDSILKPLTLFEACPEQFLQTSPLIQSEEPNKDSYLRGEEYKAELKKERVLETPQLSPRRKVLLEARSQLDKSPVRKKLFEDQSVFMAWKQLNDLSNDHPLQNKNMKEKLVYEIVATIYSRCNNTCGILDEYSQKVEQVIKEVKWVSLGNLKRKDWTKVDDTTKRQEVLTFEILMKGKKILQGLYSLYDGTTKGAFVLATLSKAVGYWKKSPFHLEWITSQEYQELAYADYLFKDTLGQLEKIKAEDLSEIGSEPFFTLYPLLSIHFLDKFLSFVRKFKTDQSNNLEDAWISLEKGLSEAMGSRQEIVKSQKEVDQSIRTLKDAFSPKSNSIELLREIRFYFTCCRKHVFNILSEAEHQKQLKDLLEAYMNTLRPQDQKSLTGSLRMLQSEILLDCHYLWGEFLVKLAKEVQQIEQEIH